MKMDGLLLLERTYECGMIDEALKNVAAGKGSVLSFEGLPGIGKTCLLNVLQERASDYMMQVLQARGSEFEQLFSFGIVDQLFEQWQMSIPSEDRKDWGVALKGRVELASLLFDHEIDYTNHADQLTSQAILHGLYRACANQSKRRPIVILIDDAQWADLPSLYFISYLTNRLCDLSILVALAVQVPALRPQKDLLSAISSSPLSKNVRLQALSKRAVREFISVTLKQQPSESFSRSCCEVSMGNPFFLRELLAEVLADGIQLSDEAASKVLELAPRGIAQSVLNRLRRLPKTAGDLAQAIAIIGVSAEPRHAARLTSLDEAEATDAAGFLMDFGILAPGAPFRFVQPIVRNAVYKDMPLGVRNRVHARAARVLAASGTDVDQVASHLLRTQPSSDSWVVTTLRAAARNALSCRAPKLAVGYLRRALSEPPLPAEHVHVLAELGSAELRAREHAAIEHLSQALDLTKEPVRRGVAGLDLCLALAAADRYEQAVEKLAKLVAEVEPIDEELAFRLEIELIAIAVMTARTRAIAFERLARLERRFQRHDQDQRVLRGYLALRALTRGERAEHAAQLVERIFGHELLLGETDSERDISIVAAWMLALCGRLLDAEGMLGEVVHQAHERGLVLMEGMATSLRARLYLRRGLLAEAEIDARTVLDDAELRELPGASIRNAVGALIEIQVERDELDAADKELRKTGFYDCEVPQSMVLVPLLEARGRLRIAQGQVGEGLWDLLECRRRVMETGVRCPVLTSWPHAALTLARLGRHDEARALAGEELELARSFSAPLPVAIALRTTGLLTEGRRGVELINEAACLLKCSVAHLECAYTHVELGAALHRAGQRSAARKELQVGFELADRCGATALSRRARTELVAAGVRIRPRNFAGPAILTPSEHRVANMAANGMRNKEIACSLFVTVKTVEWHLGQAYRKLGIASRVELQRALSAVQDGVG